MGLRNSCLTYGGLPMTMSKPEVSLARLDLSPPKILWNSVAQLKGTFVYAGSATIESPCLIAWSRDGSFSLW